MAGQDSSFLSSLRGTRLIIAGFIALTLIIALGRAATNAYVEILWQVEAGYTSAFWTRVTWEWGTRLVAGFAILIWPRILNYIVAAYLIIIGAVGLITSLSSGTT